MQPRPTLALTRTHSRAAALWRGTGQWALFVSLAMWLGTSGFAAERPADAPTSNEQTQDEQTQDGQRRGTPWYEQVVRDAMDSVAVITVEGRDGQRSSLGSGFVVSDDGLIATNLHVIGEARPITIRFRNGRQFAVTEIHATDRALDLAVIRIDATDLRPLPLADQDHPARQGQPIVALGNPMGLRQSAVSGIVSGERRIEGRSMLQVAIPIEQGNSGGPIVDAEGRVLGIVTLKSAVTRNLGFATPVQALRDMLATPNPIAMSRWRTIGSLNPDDWSVIFGARWQQRSGQILVSESGNSFGGRALCLWRGELPVLPFEFGAFVRLDHEDGAAGLVFRSDGQDRHFGFYPSAGRLRLTRFDGPTVYSWQILDEIATPHYRHNEWNHLKVRLDANQVTCFVNDHQVFQRTLVDSTSTRIGLAKFRDTTARFRQFEFKAELEPTRLDDARLEAMRQRLEAELPDDLADEEFLASFAADVPASRQVIDEQIKNLQQQTERLIRFEADIQIRATCDELLKLFEEPDATVDLSHAALLVSKLDNDDLDLVAYQRQLDQMATEIKSEITDESPEADRLAALNRYLFQDNGFHGSRTDYYHAANSYLDRVLDDREGLPITLSVLYMELARRINLTVQGVGLPGHFVVRFVPTSGESQLIDVFAGARPLSAEEVTLRTREFGGVESEPSFLDAVSNRQIILRILRNLQSVAQRNQDSEALRRYLEAMVTLDPDEPSYRGMRAVARFQTGRKRAAIRDLDWFLEHQPDGLDLAAIHQLKARFTTEVEE